MKLVSNRLAFVATVALVLTSSRAFAEVTKEQCIEANRVGQTLRIDGKMAAGAEQLRLCADPACPGIIRDDCTARLDELMKAQPTIVFAVSDPSGSDLTEVSIALDGKALTSVLDGKAIAVDVGKHEFTFTVAGQPPVSKTLMLLEGEKGRRERVTIGTAAPPPPPAAEPVPAPTAPPPAAAPPAAVSPPPPAAPASTTPAPQPGMSTMQLSGLVGAGVGVASVVLGSVFGAMSISEKNSMLSVCNATSCNSTGHAQALNDHNSGMSDATTSTVSFVVAGALIATGAVLYFMGRPHEEPKATTSLLVVPSVGPNGGGMLLRGEF